METALPQNLDLLSKLNIEQKKASIERFKFALVFVTIPIVLGFSAVDWFFTPENWLPFLYLRFVQVAVIGITYASYEFELIREKFWTAPLFFIAISFGICIAYMAHKTGAEISIYYNGLNLLTIGVSLYLAISVRQTLITAGLVYGPYVAALFLASHELHYSFVIPHLAFIFCFVIMAMIAQSLNHKLRFAELSARTDLETQNRHKATVIEQKTKEGVELEKLTSQFSPQVVHAIKSGHIDLNQRLRREISCIFIDIANSTGRAVRIDHTEYVLMINEFFSHVIEILLKHDVTVGTFLGDGLLAFKNAPKEEPDHPAQTIQACLQILEAHRSRRKYYQEKWGSQLDIRIGLNTGYAHLGFFPNSKHGTYTALGRTVNLASRLCGQAPLNSICVTSQQLKRSVQAMPGTFIEQISENAEIKGFDGESFELYSVKPTIKSFTPSNDCPVCNSQLSPEKDFGSIVVLACSSCKYVEPIRKAA